MIARLADAWFEAEFIGRIAANGKSYWRQGSTIEGAQGLVMYCPCAYRDDNRAHGLIIPFANPRNAPACPSGFGPIARKEKPEDPDVHPRWTMSGEGFDNLTLTPSVDVGGKGSSCWHGFITNGEVT